MDDDDAAEAVRLEAAGTATNQPVVVKVRRRKHKKANDNDAQPRQRPLALIAAALAVRQAEKLVSKDAPRPPSIGARPCSTSDSPLHDRAVESVLSVRTCRAPHSGPSSTKLERASEPWLPTVTPRAVVRAFVLMRARGMNDDVVAAPTRPRKARQS